MVVGQRKPEVQWSVDERKAEDARSSQEYLNDLKEEYQARALLAKSKRLFKKGSQRFSCVKATEDTQCHKRGRNGHFGRDYFSKTLVPSFPLPNQNKIQPRLTSSSHHKTESKDFEAKYNKVKAKLALLKDVSSNDNEVMEVKALMALAEEERVSVNKECVRNREWVQISIRKRVMGVDQITKDPSSSGHKDLVFIKSSVYNTKASIPSVERPWLSEAEVAVIDSSETEYDSTDDSSVCSTSFPPLEKPCDVEPDNLSRKKDQSKKSSTSLKRCEVCGSSIHTTTNHYAIEWLKRDEALQAKKAEDQKGTMLTNTNISKTPTKRVLGVNTFRKAVGAHYLSHSSDYVDPPSIDIVRPWFSTTRYGEELFTKGTLKKTSVIIYFESASGYDALADSTVEADPKTSAPNDSFHPQQGKDEGTKNYSLDHIFVDSGPNVLVDKTKSVSDGLETVLTTLETGTNNAPKPIEEIKYREIKLEDLAKLVPNVKANSKDLDFLEYNHIIMVDDSEEDEEEDKNKEFHSTINEETKDISASTPSFPSSLPTELKELPSKFKEIIDEVKLLKTQVHGLEIKVLRDLKELLTKLKEFTTTVTSLIS
uniref:Retrovirus-related Pol polyprotein from transposon TNT 1-94 n=1 Tax=Tanacetum cinerariifolium TaxID=118510 RepID=A0A6L2JIF2_TANCI|nr:hypothetical protein [Tanacetum cinerariifolium]